MKRAPRSLFATLALPLGAAILASACGPDQAATDHGRGGAFTQLGFDEATLSDSGTPRYLSGRMEAHIVTGTDAIATFTARLGQSYRLAPETSFALRSDKTDAAGNRLVKLQQLHGGKKVVGREVVLQISTDGALEGVLGELAPELRIAAGKRLGADEAVTAALATLVRSPAEPVQRLDAPTEEIYVTATGAVPVYRARVEYYGQTGRAIEDLFVGVSDGAVVARHPLIFTALNREIYDLKMVCLKTGDELPGTLLGKEGATFTDMSAKRAYDNTGTVYWFFKHMFNRGSYDDKDALVMSSVHGKFDNGLGACSGENAAWIPDPYNQMVYGDGGLFGLTLKDLTLGFDVAAHELTHAVTWTTSELVYKDEPGALNEAMSDIHGATAEAWQQSGGSTTGNPATITPTDKTWKIGEDVAGLLLASIGALRLMDNPTKDMSSTDYWPERIMPGGTDNGGVHLNSGIANLAFYLVVKGGKHPRAKTTVEVPPISIEKAIHIFYYANVFLFSSMTDFQGARYATAKAAELLYGRCGQEYISIHKTWDAVGVPGAWTLCAKPRDKYSF